MKCPNCRLLNPPDAKICDCGYLFDESRMGELEPTAKANAEPMSALARAGCFFAGFFSFNIGLIIFIVVTIAAGVLFSNYQKTQPGKARDGLKFFGIGAGIAILIGGFFHFLGKTAIK